MCTDIECVLLKNIYIYKKKGLCWQRLANLTQALSSVFIAGMDECYMLGFSPALRVRLMIITIICKWQILKGNKERALSAFQRTWWAAGSTWESKRDRKEHGNEAILVKNTIWKKSVLGTSFQGRENERKAENSRSVQQRSYNGLSGDAIESLSFFPSLRSKWDFIL